MSAEHNGGVQTDAQADVVERYARFARDEAPSRSALYEKWARGVAGDTRISAVLAAIPATHRQPPLVFAVTRMLGAPEADFPVWAGWVLAHSDAVVVECSRRRLQTNDPLRCAALLPALAQISGPVALLEVGASAGLCLYPDRYSYRYHDQARQIALDPVSGASDVVLDCELRGPHRPPLVLPDVTWRAGIDLAPLDAADPDDASFLTALVWPGEDGRRARISAALDVVAADPPFLRTGDATAPGVLAAIAALAPADATLVVTTPGVLPHIPRAGRERLVKVLSALDAVWISIDPPGLPGCPHTDVDDQRAGRFVLTRDGMPLARVDPLGGFVEWHPGQEHSAG